jgi:hypothetical protein
MMRMLIAGLLFTFSVTLSGKERILNVPEGHSSWGLIRDCEGAKWIMYQDDATRENFFRLNGQSWIEFAEGARAEIVEARADCTKVRLLQQGEIGWIDTSLLIDPETQERAAATKAAETARKKAAHEAELRRQAAKEAAQQKQDADRRAYLAKFPTVNNGYTALFFGADRKCAVQFVEALSMEGLEKRKRLADLISYQCGFMEKIGVHVQKLQVSGDYLEVKIVDGDDAGKSGWVPSAWVK